MCTVIVHTIGAAASVGVIVLTIMIAIAAIRG
jgi:hypothetical protein